MTYDPDRRYAHDLEATEAAKPLAEDTEGERGQFWNVDRHIRGRWIRTGLIIGFIIVLFIQGLAADHLHFFGLGYGMSSLLKSVMIIAAGGLLGFIAATIRRRRTRED